MIRKKRNSIIGERSRTLEIIADFGPVKGPKAKTKTRMAEAICRVCGNTKIVNYHTFANNKHNCKCSHIHGQVLPPGISSRNSILRMYKSNAKAKNIPFTLTDEEFFVLIRMDCFYCGCPPSQIYRHDKNSNGAYTYNGVDRLDNDYSVGYTKENSKPCCGLCNKIKHYHSLGEIYIHIEKMYRHLSSSVI